MSHIVTGTQKNSVATGHEVNRTRQFLTFLIGQDLFGVDILEVKEILEISTITQIPMTPNYIRGVINLRGSVVPIIDLAARLERQPSEIGKHSCMILVSITVKSAQTQFAENHILGLLVDRVNEIMEFSAENILPAPDFGSEIRTEFIHAMGRVDNSFVILLALDRVLTLAELSQLQKSVNSQANTLDLQAP